MKRIFILLTLLLCSVLSFSQSVVQRSSTAITEQDGNLFAQNSFRPAVYLDTTAANSVTSLDSCGKLIFTYVDNSYWMRVCAPTKHWVKLLKTGDVAATIWGTITGTLSSQTDLQNALNLKFNISDTTNKWIQNVYSRNDSLFKFKNGTESFIHNLSNATNNVNIGSGFRILNANTQEMRTLFAGFGSKIDSVSNANGLTWRGDTTRRTGLPTYYYIDSSVSTTILTANNGLTKTANNVQLGGPLAQTTNISVGTNELDIIAANGATSTTRFTIDNTNTVISGRYEDFSSINTIYTNQDNIQIVSTQPTGARRILIDSTTGITIGENVGGVYKGIIFKKGTAQLQANGYTGTNFQTIDSSFNTLVIDGSGNIFKRAGGGGGSQTLQGVITQGATLNQTNTINYAGFRQSFKSGLTILDSLSIIPAVYRADSMVYAGTSITLGIGTTFTTHYTTLTSNQLNTAQSNHGISGAQLSLQGIADTINLPSYDATKYRGFVSEWGVNDMQIGTYDSTTFSNNYKLYIDALVRKGWPLSKIRLLQNGTVCTCISGPATTARQLQFRQAISAVGTAKGVTVVDIYSLELARGGDAAFQYDGIHPNQYATPLYAALISKSFGDSVRIQNQSIASNGLNEFQNIKIRTTTTGDGYRSSILATDTAGNVVRLLSNTFIYNTLEPSIVLPQPGGIYMSGQGKFATLRTTGVSGVSDSLTALYVQGTSLLNGKLTTTGDVLINGITFGHGNGNNVSNLYAGAAAGTNNSGENGNTGIGNNALQGNTIGYFNTGQGYLALNGNQTGHGNVAFGVQALYQATGSGNVAIGTQAGYNQTTGDNKFWLSNSSTTNLVWGDFSNGHYVINPGSSPSDNGVGTLQVKGKITVDTHTITSNSDSAVIWDRSTNEYKVAKINGTGSTTIYSGDGTLAGNRTVTGGANTLTFTSTTTGSNATMTVNNTSSGHALLGNASGAGYGVYGIGFRGVYGNGSGGGTGVYGQETSGIGLRAVVSTGTALVLDQTPSSFNDIQTSIQISRLTSGNSGLGANGIGTQFIFAAPTTTSTSASTGGALNWSWSTATNASRTGRFAFQLVNNAGSLADKFIVNGTGQLATPGYGSGTFSGTPAYTTEFDASGNVLEKPIPYSLYYSDTSATTVANTTTETSVVGNVIGSTSLNGGLLQPGSVIKLKGYGYLSTDVTPGNLTVNFIVSNFTLGITLSTLLPAGVTNNDIDYEFEVTPFGLGVNQDMFYIGKIDITNNATGAVITQRFQGKGAITTTGTLATDITAKWSVANANNILNSRNNVLEVRRIQ